MAEKRTAGAPPEEEALPASEPEAPVAPTAPVGPEAPVAPDAPVLTDDGEPQEPDAAEHERQLEHDIEELTAKADKAEEYLELAQRTKADFENYRKRAARESAAAQERGVAKLARELLPAVDSLDRALEAAQGTAGEDGAAGTLASGIKLVHADVIAA